MLWCGYVDGLLRDLVGVDSLLRKMSGWGLVIAIASCSSVMLPN